MSLRTKPVRWTLISVSYLAVAAIAALAAAYLTRQWEPGYSTPARTDFPRRLAGEAGAGNGTYRFFYVTTRPQEDLLDPAAARRSGRLSVGTFRADISPSMAVAPRAWEDPDLLQVLPPAELETGEFNDRLRAAMTQSSHRSVLIVVWGWKERWQSAAAKTAYLAYLLDIDTPVVVFDWPANQGTDARGYLAAHKIARTSGADLGRFVEGVVGDVRPDRLWLVALSMGSQVVCESFEYMSARAGLSDPDREIEHVVLAAPDVARDEFEQQFADQINRLSDRLTVYVSSTDQALLLSQWVNRRPRVGRLAQARPDDGETQFAHADRLLNLESAAGTDFQVVDVTPINRHRNRHHFLTDDPEFLDELYVRLLAPQDAMSRRLYPLGTDSGADFWILWDQ